MEIVHPTLGINQVQRLGEIDFLKKMMRETARVSSFHHEVVSEFAGKGKIHHLGIRRLQVIIDAPRNGQTVRVRIIRWRVRETAGRRRNFAGRQIIEPEEPGVSGRIIYSGDASRIAESGSQSPGAVAVEGVDDAFTEVVKVDAVAGAD